MERYSKNFRNRKSFSFQLEGEKDPKTGMSEVDLLEEIARLSGFTMSKIIRIAFLEYAKKKKYFLSKDPRIDHYLDGNTEEIPLGEPSILDSREKWKKFLENCDKDEFFKILKALNDTRDQAISIMNTRKLRKDDKPVKYVADTRATERSVPMGGI